MTELERLTEKLQSIFDSYKTDWLNFYDDKIRTNLAQSYFDEFDSLRPQC